METKSYQFVKNFLWPFKSKLEISDQGINNNGKVVKWDEVKEYTYGINSINGSMNYMFIYRDNAGKKSQINYVVSAVGNKKKKEMFADIYNRLDHGFSEKVTEPKARELSKQIAGGGTATLSNCALTNAGITIRSGLIKKESVSIPWNQVKIGYPEGTGAFSISLASDPKKFVHIKYYGDNESRLLHSVIQKMLDQQPDLKR